MTDEDKAESSPEESVRALRSRIRLKARLNARSGGDENARIEGPRAEEKVVQAVKPASARLPESPPVEAAAAAPVGLRRRQRRGRVACLFGMFLGFAGLIAGRLGVLWIQFDVFSHFTLHFAAIIVAFLVGYLMPRMRVITAVALIILAVVAIGLWPHLASRKIDVVGTATGAERSLRLMSFNTKLSRNNGDAVADEVLRNDPDVAVLLEFGEEKRSALEKLKSRYPYQADCTGIPECQLAMIARLPFANVQWRGPWEGPPLIRVSFGPELAGLTVIGVHTARFPQQRVQLRQIEQLSRLLDEIEGPHIVAGDFNATPFSRLLGTFANRSRMNRLTSLPTWPTWLSLPQVAIDHVFVSRGIRILEAARIGGNAGSDHYPVIVGLAVSQR